MVLDEVWHNLCYHVNSTDTAMTWHCIKPGEVQDYVISFTNKQTNMILEFLGASFWFFSWNVMTGIGIRVCLTNIVFTYRIIGSEEMTNPLENVDVKINSNGISKICNVYQFQHVVLTVLIVLS